MLSLKWFPGLLCGAMGFAQTPSPVVLELFTSEGCSSCVAADTLFTQIENGRVSFRAPAELITLGEHVDYWDSSDWRDRFSSPLFSSRQQDYGRAFREQNVYTPMVVVNGQSTCVGSDLQCIQRAAQDAAQTPQAAVRIRNGAGNDVISVSVQRLPPGGNLADVLLSFTESDLRSNILGGENRGRRANHAAVVRSMIQLSRIDEKKGGTYSADVQLNLNPRWDRRNLKLIVLVQDSTNRRILGAASSHVCAAGPGVC